MAALLLLGLYIISRFMFRQPPVPQMGRRKLDPRKVIGSVSTAEFAVTVAISVGFLISLGSAGVDWRVAVGALVGGVTLITNSRTLMRSSDNEIPAVFAGWAVLIALAVRRTRVLRAEERGAATVV